MPATYFPAIVDRSASGFGVTFPDFPGCIAAGDTVSEACIQAEKALALHIEGMTKDKDAIPAPSGPEAMTPTEPDDVCGVMVRADVPAKVERVLVSIDANLLRAIDAAAPNRSAFLAEAARIMLQMNERKAALAATLRNIETRLSAVTDKLIQQEAALRSAQDPFRVDKSPRPPEGGPGYSEWKTKHDYNEAIKRGEIERLNSDVTKLREMQQQLATAIGRAQQRVARYSSFEALSAFLEAA